MDADPLADVVADLYALPPEEFVAARDIAVKRARAAGDRRLATEIGKLRRPTVGAWAVNLLARQRPELVDELIELGEALRSAQRELRGEELRELSMRRRAVVAGLARAAVRLAGRVNLPVAEIEATFTAALAGPGVAEQVRAGRLTRTIAYAGFGETPRPKLRLIHGGEPQSPVVAEESAVERGAADKPERGAADEPERGAADKAAGRREAENAEKAENAAKAAKAAEAERRRAEKVAAAERRAAERAAAAQRRRARAAAHRELLAARTALAEAEEARAQAERAVIAARRRVEKADAILDSLDTEQ